MRVEVVGKVATFRAPTVLLLTKEQADIRTHNLKHVKGDRFQVVGEVQFKIGETLGVFGEITKKRLIDLKNLDQKEDEKN